MNAAWCAENTRGFGLVVFIGHASTGLEWRRHGPLCEPGYWRVGITGWGFVGHAVVDDFGNLVQVRP